MEKLSATNKKSLKDLQAKLKVFQAELVEVNKREGKDAYIGVKVKNNQGRFARIKKKDVEAKDEGKFFLALDITAKEAVVYIPLSVASGKKTAGFMYQIEGTAEGKIVTTDIKVRGDGVTQVTVGTLLYAKVPARKTASFEIRATIRGQYGKVYKLVFTRLNYKLNLTDARYQQYLKEIHSDSVKFS